MDACQIEEFDDRERKNSLSEYTAKYHERPEETLSKGREQDGENMWDKPEDANLTVLETFAQNVTAIGLPRLADHTSRYIWLLFFCLF
jgi:hypothetical protein